MSEHHLDVRRRIYKKLEQFPSTDGLKRFFDKVMYVVAIGGPFIFLPQAIQIFMSGQVAGLSLLTWCLLVVMNVLWVFYGLLHKEIPIVASNGFNFFINLLVVAAILIHA